jgi:glycosyltransferase involved in cell wall biosynthesis
MRTVEALKKLGSVYYQFSGSTMPDERDNLHYFAIKKEFMQGRFSVQKRWNFDKQVLELIRTTDCDLVYFHGFPSSMPIKVFRFARRMGKKIIYDLHEIMPVHFLPERYSFLSPIMWQILRVQLRIVDAIVGVSDEATKMMLDKTGTSIDVLTVPNYANFAVPLSESLVKNDEIIVVGLTNRNFSINDRLLKELKRKFRIVSIGAPNCFADEALPFMEYESMMERLSKAKFTLLAHHSRSDFNFANDVYSLPNKFFDSLAAGTPVILAERFICMKKIVEETNTGIVLNLVHESDEDLKTLQESLNHYNTYIQSLKLYQDKFAWNESKEAIFNDFIMRIMKS